MRLGRSIIFSRKGKVPGRYIAQKHAKCLFPEGQAYFFPSWLSQSQKFPRWPPAGCTRPDFSLQLQGSLPSGHTLRTHCTVDLKLSFLLHLSMLVISLKNVRQPASTTFATSARECLMCQLWKFYALPHLPHVYTQRTGYVGYRHAVR